MEMSLSAGETEFAQDKTFGYHCSNLKDYVEEKTGGRYPAREVLDISLEELRSLDYSVITDKLLALHDFGKIVVNAVDACDLKVFCIALYDAMKQGRRFMFRTAAGFVKEFGAVSDRPLLSREEMVAGDRKTGGIIVVGSHTKKTTSQLEELKAVPESGSWNLIRIWCWMRKNFRKRFNRLSAGGRTVGAGRYRGGIHQEKAFVSGK